MDIKVYCKEKQHHSILPQPLRCLIVGPSGCGKTNLLLNLIYNKDGAQFAYLYVFSRSLDQQAYVQLQDLYKTMKHKVNTSVGYFYSSCDELITVDDCKPNALVVFDDCLMDNQSKIKDYFVRGRHKNISCVYISQSYGRVDMQVIRNNINLLCAFNQNKHYTQRIHSDFVGSDMAVQIFTKLCNECWNTPHGFISIDMTKKLRSGKYKCMLNKPLTDLQ